MVFEKGTTKVAEKKDLLKELKEYKNILNSSIIEYFNSLIELEFSVVKNNISENDRKVLSTMDFYNRISIYNIYNRILHLFSNNNIEFKFQGNAQGYDGIRIYKELDSRAINLFNFGYGKSLNFSDYSPMTIRLFQTLPSEGKLPYKRELTKDDMIEIEITNKILNLILKDYGLLVSDFEEKEYSDSYTYGNKILVKKLPNLELYTKIKYK